jgi:hypothetical protein
MNFTLRPSKSFLFDLLENQLGKARGQIGLDAASADFKNRFMFQTSKYYGLDNRLEAIKKGIKKNTDRNCFGIWADMTKLDALPGGSVDALVCTNAFVNFSKDYEVAVNVTRQLSRITAPQGVFMCQLELDSQFDNIIDVIKSEFKDVKIYYYRNIISLMYEKIFEKNTHLSNHKIAGSKPFRLFAWLLSRMEFLTCRAKLGNRQAFVVARQKNDQQEREFNLTHLKQIENRLYQLNKQ